MRAFFTERAFRSGEVLFEPGKRRTKFFVRESNCSIEVVHPYSAGEHLVPVPEPGGFTGEITVLAGIARLSAAGTYPAGSRNRSRARADSSASRADLSET